MKKIKKIIKAVIKPRNTLDNYSEKVLDRLENRFGMTY